MGTSQCCMSKSGPADVSALVGPPTAACVAPGQCAFSETWSEATLISRVQVSRDTILVTFELPDPSKPLGLSTCACVLAKFNEPGVADPIVRPYTPVSTNAMLGKFQLMLKVYDLGQMSQHLNSLPTGSAVEFKHIPQNVKVQYPFGRKHITMIGGGTGITPLMQALHAILGTAGDTTVVTMLYGNKTADDILCKAVLNRWEENSAGRLKIHHILSRLPSGEHWDGLQGRIDKEKISKYSVPPSEDVLVMVCGPPPMYSSLCGPRDDKNLTGALAELGFNAEQVFKF